MYELKVGDIYYKQNRFVGLIVAKIIKLDGKSVIFSTNNNVSQNRLRKTSFFSFYKKLPRYYHHKISRFYV